MNLHILSDDQSIEITSGQTILQASIAHKVPLSHICGGPTRCTTCRVRILEGLENCGPRTDQEKVIAEQSHFPDDIRLGCQTTILGDVQLRRLVVDEEDLAMTAQAVVERVRTEIFQMKQASDLSRIIGVLWEGLHDVGIRTDYCAVAIQREGEWGTIAVAGNWLERRHAIEPMERNVSGPAHCYAVTNEGVLPTDVQESFRRGWSLTEPDAYASGSWWDVPFEHGQFVVMSRREDAFDTDEERILATFGDAVALAYVRASDFQRLEHSNAELQETLSELKRTQAELVQSAKMASLGQLVAGVAHEVNTPLGAIHSNNDTLGKSAARLRESLPQDDAKLKRIVDVIDNLSVMNASAIDRIDKVITNLRRFARLNEASLARYDIRIGIEHTIALIGHEYTGRIDLRTAFEDVPQIECYPNLINQALMSVILNACQAIPSDATVTVATRSSDPTVTIEVTDTGEGIATDDLAKIFDPGYTTRGVGVGTGLGLSTVHQIIEKHTGTIAVSSEVNSGTTIKIELPIHP